MNMGLTEEQMRAFIAVIEAEVGAEQAHVSQDVLNSILNERRK